jgi:CHAT domain-containing protein/Tfp pilus assembly protein PilF
LRLVHTLPFALLLLASTAAFGEPAVSCTEVLHAARSYVQERLTTLGTTPAQVAIPVPAGHAWVIEVREQGNDLRVEVRDGAGHLLAQADHPERRTGTRRLIISPPSDADALSLRVTGKEHEAVTGTVDIAVTDLAALSKYPTCLGAYRSLAAADADYAIAQQISLARAATATTPAAPATTTAREAYLRAAQEYLSAEQILDRPADATLRGETALALAGVRYFDLQDWRGSAEWAATAQSFLGSRDPYRRARAQALAAAAWIEMATASTPRAPAVGNPDAKALLVKARRTLEQLVAFHRRRGESYDEALQINNIALSYLYESRFHECVAAARSASELFAQLHEAPRQGLAWQNRALCYWGLGHLPEALGALNRALKVLKPEPYPQLYLPTLSNTALLNYALGHFDTSLRLHDQSLELATRSQNLREQAQSLYGIGVTYYALGDRTQAREFLERALAIRTTAFDARGRRATLRSLATVYADLGEYHKAIELDHEALALATSPTSRARSRIQLAVHTALDGNPQDALAMLAELLEPGAVPDPLIRAQARLQRAIIERRSGAFDESLRDLEYAAPVFRSFGSVTDGFSADLERARDLRLAGNPSAALAAVDRALDRSEAIRTQTANPEFRAQLQLPLRAAYDLKLDLLWDEFERADRDGHSADAARIAAAAFQSADGARARSFADIAAQQYSPAIRRDLAAELARRELLYRNLTGLRFALDTRLDHAGSADPRARDLAGEIAGLQRQVDTLNNTIAARTAGPQGNGTGSPSAITAAAQRLLPADAAIIAYWLGEQAAYAWVATPAGIHWVRLTDPATITAAARAFHDSLKRLADLPRERRLDTGAALYDQIIRPIAEWVAPRQRWFFIPDAALNYVPFAALRAGAGAGTGTGASSQPGAGASSPPGAGADSRYDPEYIVSAHDVALAPAAWLLLAPARRSDRPRPETPRPGTPRPGQPRPQLPSAQSRILLVSDPVYERSDPRLHLEQPADNPARAIAAEPATAVPSTAVPSTAVPPVLPLDAEQRYERIPGTAREAAAIQAEFPAAEVDSLSGLQATRDRLLQLDWSQYRFIHIAAHGHLDARMPQLSALVLSAYDQHGDQIEGALRTADLSALTLTAEVAVFSGCDTALGKDVLNEGMVGMAYATLARGAGAVVSSLWQVPDEIGATLMTEFYRHLIRDSMSPVTALSASMRSVLKRNPSADPALWGAFQVSVVTIPRPDLQTERGVGVLQ